MKNLLLFTLFLLTTVACSRNGDPVNPDGVTLASGTYQMTYYRLDADGITEVDTNLPIVDRGQTVVSGTMTLTRGQAANSVNIRYRLIESGSPDEDLDFGDFTLQKNGNRYDLYDGTVPYGTVDGTTLTYDETFTDADGVDFHLTINARR